MFTKHSKFFLIGMILILAVLIIGCGTEDKQEAEEQENQTENENETEQSNQAGQLNKDENPVVTVTMENEEQIVIELYPDIAPNTVNNFISLIEDGFYDGLIFHRVIPDFIDRKSTRLNSSHVSISYAVFCLKKKNTY